MIDMHSHVLPCIDDGARSIDISLKMLEAAKNSGAEIVAATPHCILRKFNIDAFLDRRQNAYSSIEQELLHNPLKYPKIVMGAEVLLCEDITEYENFKKLCYGSTNYILLELSSHVSCSVLAEWIYNVSINGLVPVIAHIDRFHDYKRMMSELDGIDVVYQINATRFLGLFSSLSVKNILRCATKFLVSSDMHNLDSRSFNMHLAYNKAVRYLPKEMCGMMFGGLAEKILLNK